MLGLLRRKTAAEVIAEGEAKLARKPVNWEGSPKVSEAEKMINDHTAIHSMLDDYWVDNMAEEVPKVSVPIVLVKPSRTAPVLTPLDDLSDYEEVANTLGYMPAELEDRHRTIRHRILVSFCLDHGFPIYDNTEVHKYMTGLAQKVDKIFYWARLDKPSDPMSAHVSRRLYQISNHGELSTKQYRHAVPLDILKRAASVKKHFGDEIQIYVSDYAVPDPDPFVMAVLEGCGHNQHVVFGMWDEPGFKAIGRDQ